MAGRAPATPVLGPEDRPWPNSLRGRPHAELRYRAASADVHLAVEGIGDLLTRGGQ